MTTLELYQNNSSEIRKHEALVEFESQKYGAP